MRDIIKGLIRQLSIFDNSGASQYLRLFRQEVKKLDSHHKDVLVNSLQLLILEIEEGE